MSLKRKLRARLVSVYLGERLLRLKRWWYRRTRRKPRQITFFHQLDDPHSHLLLQVLPRLDETCRIRIRLVPTPQAQFTPDRERLARWAFADARLLADRYGLSLPDAAAPPPQELLKLAHQIAIPVNHDFAALQRIGDVLLSGNRDGLDGRRNDNPVVHLAENQQRLHRMGHYLGGMIHYEGEWYWGIDRLNLLLSRLEAEGVSVGDVLPAPTPMSLAATPEDTPLEFFFSFRSPYSYLAIQRTLALAAQAGVRLIIRPVLPMVMRGLSVPEVKVLYIARDAARLARQQGQPFGLICDPVGPGILSCLGLFAYARTVGKEAELLQSAGRGIWAEGLDITATADLQIIATRAGLDWSVASDWLDRPEGAALAEENRQALLDAGLWGVPSFRYGDVVVWGQDRLPLVEQMLGQPSGS